MLFGLNVINVFHECYVIVYVCMPAQCFSMFYMKLCKQLISAAIYFTKRFRKLNILHFPFSSEMF